MALDKQKILNELGSVVNQLQSADCGCMGKLFTNSSGYEGGNAMTNSQPSYGGCRHGCCHNYGGYNGGHGCARGYSAPCAGGPCAEKNMCMGQCNPRKLYGDTYSYLNQNLMQPVVKEVYDDLKSLSPDNTIINDPLGVKMGLMQQGTPHLQGAMGIPQNQMMANGMQKPIQGSMLQNQIQGSSTGYQIQDTIHDMPQYQMNSTMSYPAQKGFEGNTRMSQNQMPGSAMGNQMDMSVMSHSANKNLQEAMGGMGPQIVNMMESSARKTSSDTQGEQLMNSVFNNVQQSTRGQSGVTPMSVTSGVNQGLYTNNAGMYQGQKGADKMSSRQYNPNRDTSQYQYNVNAGMRMKNSPNQHMNNPVTNIMNNSNTDDAFYSNAQNSMNINTQQGQESLGTAKSYFSPVAHQLSSANRNYGQHTQAMSKFNEMFPGVAGGDLGFDPMAIAMQMNPANHQKAAMDVMKKMMHGDKISTALDTNSNSAHLKTAIAGANAAAANISRHNQQNIPSSNQQSYEQQGTISPITQQGSLNAMPTSQYVYNANQNPPQQVYISNTGEPTINEGHLSQSTQGQQQHQTYTQLQQMIDPNTGALIASPNLPPLDEGASGDINMQEYTTKNPPSDLIIKDPILPVDTSRYQLPPSIKRLKYNDNYNTLGQPVQKVPASFYAPPQESLPQTLSPEVVTKLRNDYTGFHIKPTQSKTALMGYKAVGKTPSKKELQHIYNQYKGSQSFTQQNIRNTPQPSTYSDRKINIQVAPVEKVGGDTAANNPSMTNYLPMKGNSPNLGRTGDTALYNKAHGDFVPIQEPPKNQGKCRNGLQDQVYTSYLGSAAWSFHGERDLPFPTGYPFRNRV